MVTSYAGFLPVYSVEVSASDKTKWHIADAFEQAVCEKTFQKVTVSDISKECHIARQTFYNHFLDKYDLVNWIYDQLVLQTIAHIGIDMTWRKATETKLELMKQKQPFFAEVYRMSGSESLRETEPQKVFDYYVSNVKRLTGKTLSSLESSLLKIYCVGATYVAAEWIIDGAQEPVELLISADEASLPEFARRIFLA